MKINIGRLKETLFQMVIEYSNYSWHYKLMKYGIKEYDDKGYEAYNKIGLLDDDIRNDRLPEDGGSHDGDR